MRGRLTREAKGVGFMEEIEVCTSLEKNKRRKEKEKGKEKEKEKKRKAKGNVNGNLLGGYV